MAIRGYEVWRGKSWIDGSPIVAIATMKTANRKTGEMVQTWILQQDVSPVDAVVSGSDRSICGDCPHRGAGLGFAERTCYVNVGQAPLQVWKTWKAGRYGNIAASDIASAMSGKAVRLGAYGDPALIPAEILSALVEKSRLHTGYTHQWRDARGSHAKQWCMASCDSEADAAEAVEDGWRCFFVGKGSPKGSIQCPASDEYFAATGRKSSCAECGLCGGLTRSGKTLSPKVAAVIRIDPHGSGAAKIASRIVELTIRRPA